MDTKSDDKREYNNPLVYQRADPFCYKHTNGYYYFTATEPSYSYIELRRAKNLNYLDRANSRIIWIKHDSGEMGSHVWAPEIHYIDGAWYIYFAAGGAEKIWDIRTYALKCTDEDPMNGKWVEAGKIDVGHDSFSLDMTTFFNNGRQYILWAQVLDEYSFSSVFIAEMKNPLERLSEPILLTEPEYPWEKRGIPVNEAPAVLKHGGKIFVTYSAADTGANYCMGMLWCDENDDVLNPESWHKSDKPVFSTSVENRQYGPGHNCFIRDDDRDILMYHSRNYRDIDGDPLEDPNRHARVKEITYDDNGFPIFGVPDKDTYFDE